MTVTPQLVIFGKWPRAGTVKTRLAKQIGTGAAVQFYRSNLMQTVQRLSSDARWHSVLALGNDRDVATAQKQLPFIEVTGQGQGDLGQRMACQFGSRPHGPVVLIGSDIPNISKADIQSAFQALGNHDAVFGPAPDGGYWLVGMKRRPHILDPFNNVRWSTQYALADTVSNLKGKRVAMLASKRDVDNRADWLAFRAGR